MLTKSIGTSWLVTYSAKGAHQDSAPGEVAGPPTWSEASTSLTARAVAS